MIQRQPPKTTHVLKATSTTIIGDVVEYQVDLGQRLVRARGDTFAAFDEGHRVFLGVPADRRYVLEALAAS